jgi:hypothetical protein
VSTHVVNLGTEDLDTVYGRVLLSLVRLSGFLGTDIDQTTGDVTTTWATTLTPAQVTALSEIARAAKTSLTRAELNAIQSDIDGLVTYQNLANPTLAQTVLAVKAQSRILRAILRS